MTMTNQTPMTMHPDAEAAARLLPELRTELEPFAGDRIVDAVVAALDSIKSAALFIRSTGSGYAKVMRDAGAEVRRAQERERERVPTNGFGSAAEREAALREADRQVALQVGTQSARTFAAEKAAQAERIASGVVSTMKEANRRIDAAFATVNGPLTLSMPGGPLSSEELAQAASIRSELQYQKPSRLRELFDGYRASDEDGTLAMFVVAVSPLLEEIARSSLPELSVRFSMRIPQGEMDGGKVGEEKRAALGLRDAITQLREESIPESMTVARSVYQRLLPVFSTLLGWNARWLTSSERAARVANASRSNLDVHPAWLERAMPTAAGR